MATALRAAGLHVEVHDDHFRQDALDPEWLTAVGEKNWIVVTRDGAILWLRSKMIVRLELPAAREYEAKLKAEKEQKARESVPQF